MEIDKLHKLEKIVLGLMIVSIPFHGLLSRLNIPIMTNTVFGYLFNTELVLIFYEWIKYRFKIPRKVIMYTSLFILWEVLCLILGLYLFEYNELLTINQIPMAEWLYGKLNLYGFNFSESEILKTWIFIRFTKSLILFDVQLLFLGYFIYHIYQDDFCNAFADIRKALLVLLSIMGIYSIIELGWLKLSLPLCRELLIRINNLIYAPASSHGWWPPLLWNGQLRSVCHEPSFFGIIMILTLPFIWSYIYERKYRWLGVFFTFYFTILIASTNARTAIIVTIIETLLLIAVAILRKNSSFNISVLVIVILTISAYGVNLIDWQNSIKLNRNIAYYNIEVELHKTDDIKASNENKVEKNVKKNLNSVVKTIDGKKHSGEKNKTVPIEKKTKEYIDKNILSITEKNVRSNNARLGSNVAYLAVAVQNPIFGVGNGLTSAYVDANIPEFAKQNKEIKMWGRYMREKGVLLSTYPSLNRYLGIAASNGFVGLFLFMTPLFYLLKSLYKFKEKIIQSTRCICVLISMVGMLIAMLSNPVFSEANGIVWGLLFCLLSNLKRRIYS